MASGISIGIGADTRAFSQGIRSGVLEPLEGVEDALHDVERAGEQVDDGLVDGFRDANRAAGDLKGSLKDVDRAGKIAGDELVAGFRDAQRETRDLEGANKDLADTIRNESRKSSRAVKDIGDEGFGKASESVEEFKSEAISNFSEVASSFSGDITQMAEGVQGLTGGLASALTPGIGIPIAVIGAAAGAFLASWQQAAEDSEERVATMFDDMLESGNSFLSEGLIQQSMADIATDSEKWAESVKIAGEAGVSAQTTLRALSGDQEALNTLLTAENDKHAERIENIQNAGGAMEDIEAQKILENAEHQKTIDKLNTIVKDTDTAAARAAAVRGAFESGNPVLDKQLRKIQDIAAALGGLGDKTIKINADTTGVEGAFRGLEGRNITVNLNGQITKIGQQVW
jgi:hypothetical protein